MGLETERPYSPGKVVDTLAFAGSAAEARRLRALGAGFIRREPGTGRDLWRTAAGLVLRRTAPLRWDVLAGCVC